MQARTKLLAFTALSLSAAFVATNAAADVTILSDATQNMSCTGGVCQPTAADAVLNVGDLETLLASGNVEVTTTGSGVQANDLEVKAALSWSSSNTLTLDAFDSIAVDKGVSVAGAGGLALTTNDGGAGGALSFDTKGSVSFQSLPSTLTINGVAYVLANSVAALASAVVANPDGAYALANSYDASVDGTYSTSPMDTTLNGVIEGLGNTISNLRITTKPARHRFPIAALVHVVGVTGTVGNLRLKGIRYSGKVIGGLVAQNFGVLFGDEVAGSINSKRFPAGGLVGANSGTIVHSSADVRVTVGCCKYGSGTGGLVYDNAGIIELSRATGDISGSGASGGLAAFNEGSISQSYATGSVNYGGGLVGTNLDVGTISNSYATGAMTGNGSGGFVWGVPQYTTGTITASYSSGAVKSEGGRANSVADGGFICTDDATNLGDDYWDTTTSGTAFAACGNMNAPGVNGLTTEQLQAELPQGFDPKIWTEKKSVNNGLPFLINNPPPK